MKLLTVKKIVSIVDNLNEIEQKRLQLVNTIQKFHQEGYSISKIARILGKSRNTIKKYITGNPKILCRSTKRGNLTLYDDLIIQCLMTGMTQADTLRKLYEAGYTLGDSNARMYLRKLISINKLDVSKYVSTEKGSSKKKTINKKYITRKGIFQYLWMNGELTTAHHEKLWNMYDVLPELEKCIREFRELFTKRNLALLYLFIEKYKKSSIKELVSFANGLEKDFQAVENAAASELSNGFVEGTNSKLKMIKRTMFGRCGIKLLSAKLMYVPN